MENWSNSLPRELRNLLSRVGSAKSTIPGGIPAADQQIKMVK